MLDTVAQMSQPQSRSGSRNRPAANAPRDDSPTLGPSSSASTPHVRPRDTGSPFPGYAPGHGSPRFATSASSSPTAGPSGVARTGRPARQGSGTPSRSSSIESLRLDDVAEALPTGTATIVVNMYPFQAEELKWHRRKEAVSLFTWKRATWLSVGIPHVCSETTF